ncbi:MAG: hypothetical protein K0S47_1065 [Herbinix sp.]|nr:hypothetical protein [Herbinix sp.]
MKVRLYKCGALIGFVLLLMGGCDQKKETAVNTEISNQEVIAPVEGEGAEAADESSSESESEEETAVQVLKTLEFSENDYFYADDIEIKINSTKAGSIYYTTDGTEPDQTKTKYDTGILLTSNAQLKVTSVKAKAFFDDGTESETIVHTYFLGKDIKERFDTLIFSVTTDPYNLYDYEYGIFVEGKLRDDYIKENPDDTIEPNDPANFNRKGRESEREVNLEILTPEGEEITDQAAGIRTYGGWSRAREQKSIKIFARKDYDEENNKLKYEFFPDRSAVGGDGNELDSFKQLVLRNCGNDNGFAFIRDELFQSLAGLAGYQDYEAVRPVTLFINGEYQGFYWLHEVYCDEYFEDHYGDYEGSFEIIEGGETFKNDDADFENSRFIRDYEAMYTYAWKDLNNSIDYERLCELMDVENYLSYYALQIYIGNEDWPHNNYKTYRYYAAEGEEYGQAPFDGKWRYLLHDLDFSFGIYGSGPQANNITNFVGQNGEMKDAAPLFSQLMKREDCKEYFITQTLDILNGAFAPRNLDRVLTEMNASRVHELSNMYDTELIEDWVYPDQLEGRLSDVRNYGKSRAEYILSYYQEFFMMDDIYNLKVTPADECEVMINSYRTNEYFDGSYYSNYNTTITPILPSGKTFEHWLVNGKERKKEELVITSSDILNGEVRVTMAIK